MTPRIRLGTIEVIWPVLVVLGLVGIAIAAFVVWVTLSSELYGDFAVPYDSAVALRENRDLYFSPASRPGLRNMNSPQMVILMAPLAWLPIEEAIIVWWAVMVAAMVGCVLLWSRALPGRWASAVFVLLLVSAPGYLNVRYANQSWLIALAVTWAWTMWRERRSSAAPVVLGAVASTKLFLLILLPYWCLRRDWRSVTGFIGGVAGAFSIGLAVCGTDAYASWIRALSEQTWQGQTLNMSILGLTTRLLDVQFDELVPVFVAPSAIVPLWLVASGLLVAAMWWVLRDREWVDRDFAVALTAMLLISPAGWVYYLPIAAGPLAAAAAKRPSRLWMLGTLGIVMPYPLLNNGQPSMWLTATLASSYTWGGLALLIAALRVSSSSSIISPDPGPRRQG